MSISPIAPVDDRPITVTGLATRKGLLSRVRVNHWSFPLVMSALIVLWQLDFNVNLPAPRAGLTIGASSGLLKDLRYFFYFHYHLGLFPVGSRDVPRLGPSRQHALDYVARHGRNLRMDFGDITNTPRFGDFGKLFMLWPDALLRGDPARATARPFNQILFIGALLATWWAFWRERRLLLGSLIVVLMGSNPFQLYETYHRANVFSAPISVALFALAVHLPYLTGRRRFDLRACATALASGVVLASLREIRTEAAIIVLALPFAYLSIRASWPRRLALVLMMVATWGVTSQGWRTYWTRSFERSASFVAEAGGRAFTGHHADHHAFWHAVYCGLGDFGGDRGFEWDDRTAFRWATTRDPVTNPRPLPYTYRGGYYLEETFDGVHHIAFTDLPEYNRLVRDRVIGAVRAEPLWYGGVLLKRVGAILGHATPASLTVGVTQWRLPGVGWLLIPVLVLLWLLRRAFEARLVLFTLPLSVVALAVYSGRGMPCYGIAHLIAFAVLIDLLARAQRTGAFSARTASTDPS